VPSSKPSDALKSDLAVPIIGVIVLGVVAAAKGVKDMLDARAIAKEARGRHMAALSDLEAARGPVHQRVAAYGDQQFDAVVGTLGRFSEWIEANQMAVNRLGAEYVGGVEIAVNDLPEMKDEVKQVRGWLKGGVAGATAAAAAPQAALAGVSALASASTGTAISGLSGAAATNAALAWLGGGAIASGGGGMAAGAVILNLVAAAPAVFVGGLTVAVIGSKQKTSAKKFAAEVSTAIANVETAISLMPKISERVTELSGILSDLRARADSAICHLESLIFDPDVHAQDFLNALQLVRGIREVINTPVLDAETGELSDVSLRVVRKYR
jgi:hypothetical protein